MVKILHLDASPRVASRSRQLAQEFVQQWQAAHPDDEIVYRDLQQQQIPHITDLWIAADFSPPPAHTPAMTEVIRLSDELVDEFLGCDRYVFSVPMYNFGVPSNVKAYIDQIVRVGRTFTMENGQFRGLVEGKKALFITTQGATYGNDSPFAGLDYQTPAIRTAFQFIGVQDSHFVTASGLDMGDEFRDKAMASAQAELQTLVTTW
ncbi:MAG: NAD(P)H-dependent oxidoreductase [Oculatellaceae cyanobacterium Prado106]|jgi:FMN-dependent NADH-azoreductase|nr:NAD(P)H-dependent oxidoreductase [Oculatellaceae cyanobacterium Prado106]